MKNNKIILSLLLILSANSLNAVITLPFAFATFIIKETIKKNIGSIINVALKAPKAIKLLATVVGALVTESTTRTSDFATQQYDNANTAVREFPENHPVATEVIRIGGSAAIGECARSGYNASTRYINRNFPADKPKTTQLQPNNSNNKPKKPLSDEEAQKVRDLLRAMERSREESKTDNS